MAIALDVHRSDGAGGSGTFTTGSLNTSAAPSTLLIAGVGGYDASGPGTITSNSPSTTWTAIGHFGVATNDGQIWYAANPSTGSAQTLTDTGTVLYDGVCFSGWTGVATASPLDVHAESGNLGSVAAAQPGSITLGNDNELVVTVLGYGGAITNLAVDSGFTILDHQAYLAANNLGAAIAYKIFGAGTSGTNVNPLWTWTTSQLACAGSAAFKAAAGGVAFVAAPGLNIRQAVKRASSF